MQKEFYYEDAVRLSDLETPIKNHVREFYNNRYHSQGVNKKLRLITHGKSISKTQLKGLILLCRRSKDSVLQKYLNSYIEELNKWESYGNK